MKKILKVITMVATIILIMGAMSSCSSLYSLMNDPYFQMGYEYGQEINRLLLGY